MRILDCFSWDKISDITANIDEIWKPVKGYEDRYLVSNKGRVKSLLKNIIIKPGVDKDGYLQFCIHKNGKSITTKIHRLVAKTFIPNPNNYPQINHKDENKQNNNVDNLEWCTSKYNVNYGARNKKAANKTRKPVIRMNMNFDIIAEYPSAPIAAKELGIAHGGITDCCNRKLRTFHKCIWRYKNENIRLSELEQN